MSEEEFSQIVTFDDLFSIYEKYNVSAGHGGIEMAYAISRQFFGDEKHIPKQIETDIPFVIKAFVYDKEIPEKIASYNRDEMDSFGYLFREDEYCRENVETGMGLWSFLYFLHDCCTLSIKENLNLYLLEEKGELFQE
ncbi:MAG TPA: hypothetical protein PKY59_14250 [Pyrinomonadaceae bacterium]|nr:hypothetical protein [Pyrinomonadaceae bacterium]